ncbi:NAD(P)H dehydrogenase (Quinone) [Neorhizobium galegae bv. officinalis bv. officinalis str. HAMBI 1141]|uniref:NAD(P)H dehydrogenase (Quinone) n=1 Tax=Neorhizobium galegae bv. officinalis bv. officinalis str. HAMBI 1141 TaxID=1028801 RepID=A0A068T791_NEOGA|nr:NAD(P)H-dependent oxidoreductase [Neorhizobium galegae]CDN53939.1 NAD(P)H dehydrogenase (Quinone) [Neorhizobium galegae bv. officinalis bv. officinalis str. HAMBI 1141]
MARIAIIQGHPDASEPHLCHALADAYARGAEVGGHSVERIELARMGVPFLTSQKEQEHGTVSPPIVDAQVKIGRSDHLVLIYPLWLGSMPALVKAFLEQVARPGFAYDTARRRFDSGLLRGKSARVVITMGMPAWYYRIGYGSHSLKALKAGILHFVGIRPVRAALVGSVAARKFGGAKWIARMEAMGQRAS